MRIGLIVPHLEPGGVETFLFRLAKQMQASGHSVTIVSDDREGDWWGRAHELGIPAVCLPSARSFCAIDHVRKVAGYLRAESFEVLLLNHARWAQCALTSLSQDIVAVPVLHNDHDGIYRIACTNADAWNVAVAVSPKVYQRATARVGEKRLVEIPYGVDLPSPADWQSRSVRWSTMRLLYCGRLLHRQKGVLLLPEIVGKCLDRGIDVTLTIAGDGPDRNALQQRFAQQELGNLVRFAGVLAPADVYPLLLQHHVLVMPSFCEGLPIISLESQACGCVPVASRLPLITEKSIEADETGILVPTGDTNGFADAIESLYRDAHRWLSMSRRGHERVERNFSVATMTAAYLRVFQNAKAGYYPQPVRRNSRCFHGLSALGWRDFLPNPVRGVFGRRVPGAKDRGQQAWASREGERLACSTSCRSE